MPSLYVVHPDVSAANLREFIALAKAKPGHMNYGRLATAAPANLPQAAADTLAAACAKAMREPVALERLGADAAIAVGGTSAEFGRSIAEEIKPD